MRVGFGLKILTILHCVGAKFPHFEHDDALESKDPDSCEMAYRRETCSTWPSQALAATVSPRLKESIEEVVSRIFERFPQGVRAGLLQNLMRKPCMQRLCLHVQLIDGHMYVVAPDSMQTCVQGASMRVRLSCPPSRRVWQADMAQECNEAHHDPTVTRSSLCNESQRRQQQGITMPGWWSDWHYPATLEWHFSAGLNLSNCKAFGDHVPIPGDFNHVYTRLRLQSALRLLLRAYQRLHSLGSLPQPLELIFCPNEVPVNFGAWCLAGAQPVFSSTTNEADPVIPFVHWMQGPDRDVDLAYWSPSEAHRHHNDSRSVEQRWAAKAAKAVFRGALHRLSVYSHSWRRDGPRRTQVARDNWASVGGRTGLISARRQHPDLLNVRLAQKTTEAREGLQKRLGIDDATWDTMDRPEYLSLDDQASRFKYVLNVEGHGGWADREYKLMLQAQLLTIVQDMPALPWYHLFLKPFEHYVPVDSDLTNLSSAVQWAVQNDDSARQIALKANAAIRELLHPRAMFRYAEEILRGYGTIMRYRPAMHERAVQFRCDDQASQRSCRKRRPDGSTQEVRLGETRCYFTHAQGSLPSARRFHSLFEASSELFGGEGGLRT